MPSRCLCVCSARVPFFLALFTGKALSAYGRAERSSQGALQVRERKTKHYKKKKEKEVKFSRTQNRTGATPMRSQFPRQNSSGRPWAPNFTSWITTSLGFQGLLFLCYISHLSPAELRSISPAGTRPTELPFEVHTLYENIPILHSTFRQENLDIPISSS
jgi:hypothetical protein